MSRSFDDVFRDIQNGKIQPKVFNPEEHPEYGTYVYDENAKGIVKEGSDSYEEGCNFRVEEIAKENRTAIIVLFSILVIVAIVKLLKFIKKHKERRDKNVQQLQHKRRIKTGRNYHVFKKVKSRRSTPIGRRGSGESRSNVR